MPGTAQGVVYAERQSGGGPVLAIDATTDSVLWSWNPPGGVDSGGPEEAAAGSKFIVFDDGSGGTVLAR